MELKDFPHTISFRDIRYPRMEFRTGELMLILPHSTDPNSVIEKHKKWISEKIKFIEECKMEAETKVLVQRKDDDFKSLVLEHIIKISNEIGVRTNNVIFRTLKTKWASLSPKLNMTVNMLMKYLPENLIEYILYHEHAHLRQKYHNGDFWKLIKIKYKDIEKYEKDLFTYWFKIHNK